MVDKVVGLLIYLAGVAAIVGPYVYIQWSMTKSRCEHQPKENSDASSD